MTAKPNTFSPGEVRAARATDRKFGGIEALRRYGGEVPAFFLSMTLTRDEADRLDARHAVLILTSQPE